MLTFNTVEHLIDTILLSGGNLVARKKQDGTLSIGLKIQRLETYSSLFSVLEIHLRKFGFKVNLSTVKKDKTSLVLYVQIDSRFNAFYKDWYDNVGSTKNKKIPQRNILIDENTLAVWYAASGGPHILHWTTKSTNKVKVSGGSLYYPGGMHANALNLIKAINTLGLIGAPKLAHKNSKHGQYYYIKFNQDNFNKLINIVKAKLPKALTFKLDIEHLNNC